MSEEPDVYRCHVVAENAEALREFLRETHPDVGCHAIARSTRAGIGLDLYLRQDHLDRAGAAPLVDVTAVENVTENWRTRKHEVGGGDRFADRDAVPHGLGRKE